MQALIQEIFESIVLKSLDPVKVAEDYMLALQKFIRAGDEVKFVFGLVILTVWLGMILSFLSRFIPVKACGEYVYGKLNDYFIEREYASRVRDVEDFDLMEDDIVVSGTLVLHNGEFAYTFDHGGRTFVVTAEKGALPLRTPTLTKGVVNEMSFSQWSNRPAPMPSCQMFVTANNNGKHKQIGSGFRSGDLFLTNAHVYEGIVDALKCGVEVYLSNSTKSQALPWERKWEIFVEAVEPDVLAFKLPQQVFTVLGVKSGKIADFGSGQAVLAHGWERDLHGNRQSVVSFATGICDPEVGPFAITYANNTEPGWSGSPLFNQKGAVVGMHKGSKEDINRNVGISLFWLPRLLKSLDPTHVKLESDITQKGYKLSFLTKAQWEEDREERRLRQLEHRTAVEEENDREFEFGIRIGRTPYFLSQSAFSQQVSATRVDWDEWERSKTESGQFTWADMEDEAVVIPPPKDVVQTASVKVPDFRVTQTRGSLSRQSEPQSHSICSSSPNSPPTQMERESLLLELAKRSEANITNLNQQILRLKQDMQTLKNSKTSVGHPVAETTRSVASSSKAEDSLKESNQLKSKLTEQSKTSSNTTPKPESQNGPKPSKAKA